MRRSEPGGNNVLIEIGAAMVSRTRLVRGSPSIKGSRGSAGVPATEKLKEMLADKKDALGAILEKIKSKVDGKSVSAEFSVSGQTVEKLLAKDN